MSVLGKVDVQTSTLGEILVNQRTAGAFAPHPRLFAKRQLYLKRGYDVLRYPILKLEHVVEVALETVGPHMAAVQAVDQLCRQSHSIAGLAHAPFQHIPDAKYSADFAYVPCLPFEYKARIASYDHQLLDLRQGGQHVFGDAVGEILLSGSPLMFWNGSTAMDGLSGSGSGFWASGSEVNTAGVAIPVTTRFCCVDAHRAVDVLQPLLAQISELDRDLAADLVVSRRRDADTAGLRDAFEPRRDVDAVAENVVAIEQ